MKKKFRKTFFISFLAFAILYSGAAYYYINIRDKETRSNADLFDKFRNEDDGNDELTFLLLGIDSKDVSSDEKERSDTMMLCNVNKSTGSVSVLSIPRDTRVDIRGRRNKEKINHAHMYGGPDLSVKTVRDFLGIDLDYYVRVDYKIVEEFVDLIGGVEVDVPIDMRYSDLAADPPLHINLKEGRQVLDGDKALQFLRFRKGYKDQDLGRIRAQQQFIESAISKTLKPGNIVKIPKMVETYYRYVDTNIPLETIMRFALKAKDINTENLEMATLPGEPEMIDKISYYIVYEEEMNELVKNMFINHETVENKSIDRENEETN
ncbi:MAG: LCP family protein [Clostridiaceae bacterium]|nr:LCP family protein [Clostridiaceae bacterium]MBW4859611.1 LCP family protein [Clostridiaceae bacterium]MBW4868580.1 LCP family protein [Clostridiaceae bacterium]